jgi:p-hydroxybenzoate 3-monooxygenase
MLLSEILHRHGVESVVLERSSREHVLSRIRAGVLESTTVDVLREKGLSARMDVEGHPHDGMRIAWAGRDSFFVDTASTLGRRFMVYGQTSIQEDLYAAADRRCQPVITEASDVVLHDFDGAPGARPYVTCVRQGQALRIDCELARQAWGHTAVAQVDRAPRHLQSSLQSVQVGLYRTLVVTAQQR